MEIKKHHPLTGPGPRSKPQSQVFENRVDCEFLDSQAAAGYLGISPNALRIMVCREKVKSYKLGRRLRFHVSDLRSLLLPKQGG